MVEALTISLIAALLLAAAARATRPKGALDFLAPAWQWWLIMRPSWLPDKPTGGCAMCTAFWLPGVPVAVAVALLTEPNAYYLASWLPHAYAIPLNLWAACVPVLVGVVFEIALEK